MKLCDVVQFYSPLGGGVRRYLEDKMRHFAPRSDVEHIVIVPGDEDSVTTRHNTTFYQVKSLRLVGSISYRMLTNQKKIHAIIDKERPDLIEVGDPYRSAWIALRAARKFNIPIVAFYHSDFPRALGRTIRRFCGSRIERFLSNRIHHYIMDLYNRMDATIVASKRMEEVLTQCGIQRVVRIPLGTDVNVFYPSDEGAEIRRELGLSPDDYLLLFVGRIAREKNIRSLIGLIEQLSHDTPEKGRYYLLLVGDGECRGLVERVTRKRSDVTWYKYDRSTSRLRAFYCAADLYVHAGTWETFGITSLEAQACGTRVLAVKNGGLDDSVAGEEPLIMAESSSSECLATAVRRIRNLSDSNDRQYRRQRIVNHFSIQNTFEKILALYSLIISGESAETFSTLDHDRDDKRNETHYKAVLTG